MRNSYRILRRKFGGKISVLKIEYIWNDNVKMDFKELVWGNVGWIHVAQGRDG
jgi:hypothetical protein